MRGMIELWFLVSACGGSFVQSCIAVDGLKHVTALKELPIK